MWKESSGNVAHARKARCVAQAMSALKKTQEHVAITGLTLAEEEGQGRVHTHEIQRFRQQMTLTHRPYDWILQKKKPPPARK